MAEVMLSLVEKDELVGGTVLEVGKDQVRQVEVLNDVGPSGAGHSVSANATGTAEVWELLKAQSQ